jgi:hypothetical protein
LGTPRTRRSNADCDWIDSKRQGDGRVVGKGSGVVGDGRVGGESRSRGEVGVLRLWKLIPGAKELIAEHVSIYIESEKSVGVNARAFIFWLGLPLAK